MHLAPAPSVEYYYVLMENSCQTGRPSLWLKAAARPAVSRVLGRLYNTRVPFGILGPVIKTYANVYNVDLSEVDRPLYEYSTFGEFFSRSLRQGAREFDSDPRNAVWPCDGTVVDAGEINEHPHDTAMTVKGVRYPLNVFLGYPEGARQLARGGYVIVHLKPGDYHRMHWPVDVTIKGIRHIPGRRYPVNSLGLNSGARVYTENERVVIVTEYADKHRLFVVLVSAFSVGGISLKFDTLKPDTCIDGFPYEKWYPAARPGIRGEEIGAFHLGSSLVLAWSRGLFGPVDAGIGRVRTGSVMTSIMADVP